MDLANTTKQAHSTPVTHRAGDLRIFGAICTLPGLDGQDAMLISALAEFIRHGHTTVPIGCLAARSMTSRRTARRRIQRLRERGLLVAKRSPLPRPNEYRLAGPLAHLNAQKEFGPNE